MVGWLHRDLLGAGIAIEYPRGDDHKETIDFHTLRSTAITLWLVDSNRTQLEVARLAGLKTTQLVERYSRGFRLDTSEWVEKGADLNQTETKPKEEAG